MTNMIYKISKQQANSELLVCFSLTVRKVKCNLFLTITKNPDHFNFEEKIRWNFTDIHLTDYTCAHSLRKL